MTVTVTCVRESYEEPTLRSPSRDFDLDRDRARKRRRHSSYQARSWSLEREDLQMVVDRFVEDLGRRLEMLEAYGHWKIDESKNAAYSTLHSLYAKCTQVRDDTFDAGRRRAKIMVDTLETQRSRALAHKESFDAKVKESLTLAETTLADFERKAYNIRQNGFAATAQDVLDSGMAYVGDASSKAAEMVHEGADAARRAQATMKLKVKHALAQARTNGLITYDALPEPWRVNPHILRGYRFSETTGDCIRSCFTISNELVNIWSHAIGLLVILAIAFYFYPTSSAFTSATGFDISIAGLFFFAAAKCLVCSTMWHTMASISDQPTMERFACVDYTGISLLVAASIMTVEYTAFYCEPISRWCYMLTTFVLGTAGTVLPWHPTFGIADMAWLRVAFYVSLAATGFFPVLQLSLERGLAVTMYFYAPITKSILVYLGGALLYAAKIPERFFPGFFDYVGGSHNIWHVAVLGGILFHYSAMQTFFSEAFKRAGNGECSIY